jgi:elongation factor Ts
MSSDNVLEKVKQLREVTGVGFKDCKNAIEESNGDIEKSIELLRKKGIAKATKRMGRVASEGLVSIHEKNNKLSIAEINCETDFVAKNEEFIKFIEEISEIVLTKQADIKVINSSEMKNKKSIENNLIDLISKIGEKITLRRVDFLTDTESKNFSYIHSSVKKNIGKLGVIVSLETKKQMKEIQEFGKQLAMHIAATSPIAIDKEDLNPEVLKKEKEIIFEELKNSGKDLKIIDKIASGKLNKFINDSTLLNQEWIMDPKKKVKDILNEVAGSEKIIIKKYTRFKVGEGV